MQIIVTGTTMAMESHAAVAWIFGGDGKVSDADPCVFAVVAHVTHPNAVISSALGEAFVAENGSAFFCPHFSTQAKSTQCFDNNKQVTLEVTEFRTSNNANLLRSVGFWTPLIVQSGVQLCMLVLV